MGREFSARTRDESFARFAQEEFDVLIVGGGVTGAASARDAVSRGLKTALIDMGDFAWGTSSRSSKLIHGGLRYLENFEFRLVFEALSERALLIKTTPHMVRPLPFYLPVYEDGSRSRVILDLGLWLYDLLALLRTPGFHSRLSRAQMSKAFPALRREGLKGGFRYFDASMWDDVLVHEILRSASSYGVAAANYVKATRPIWSADRITGFEFQETIAPHRTGTIRAKHIISCVGPWTDLMGHAVQTDWKPVLNPSRGVHIVFDAKRFPVPGAMIMAHPVDGRVSFVIPREDFGAGVVIVGTTDGPSNPIPEQTAVEAEDIDYLLNLLAGYFPDLALSHADIVSTYVGVRPLVKDAAAASLQKVSREHTVWPGPGGMVFVAGGKYTTHRTMADEIVDHAVPGSKHLWSTRDTLDLAVMPHQVAQAKLNAESSRTQIHPFLWERYGAEALEVARLEREWQEFRNEPHITWPEGFPSLAGQLRYARRTSMLMCVDDFLKRRTPLHLCLRDGGQSLVSELEAVWQWDQKSLGSGPQTFKKCGP